MSKFVPDVGAVEEFLCSTYGNVSGVSLLKGGAWSAAFRFLVDERLMLIRFGLHPDDYERDRRAGTFELPGAPVPHILKTGSALDCSFAISRWVEGESFDSLVGDRFRRATEALFRAYEAIATLDFPGSGFGIWNGETGNAEYASWHDYLVAIPTREEHRLRGWRAKLDAMPEYRVVFDAAQRDIERMALHCPNDRHVNHNDPLQGNILIDRNDNVAAMLDWGSSIVGDPLYELAMLMFCQPWKPDIDVQRLRREAVRRFGADVDERLAGYQLHVGIQAMQYQAFAGLHDDLLPTARAVVALSSRA